MTCVHDWLTWKGDQYKCAKCNEVKKLGIGDPKIADQFEKYQNR